MIAVKNQSIKTTHQNIKIRASIAALTAMALYFLNPFGLRTATVKYSEDLFIRFLSPWYGEQGDSETVVILIDDYFINKTEKRYPITYSQLIQLFRIINQHQPAAIFLDIFHQYEHSKKLEQWLNLLEHARFPVFMASLPWIDTPKELSSPDSLRHKVWQATQLTVAGWEGDTYAHYYPMLIKNPYFSASDPASKKFLSTAAFDLYKVWCRKKQDVCPIKNTNLDNPALWVQPMVVKWSSRAAPLQEADLYLSNPCKKVPTSRLRQILELVYLGFGRCLPDFSKNMEQHRKNCFHLRTLSAALLLKPEIASNRSIREALQGKIVLVGYNLEGSNDKVDSPVHGQMAGVFYHAMALDNLINYGNRYWHVPQAIPQLGTITLSDVCEGIFQGFALCFFLYYRMWHLSLASWRKVNPDERIHKEKKRFQRNIWILSFALALLFFLSVILCFVLKWGVTNLFTLLLTVGSIFQVLIIKLPEKFEPFKIT